MSIEDILTKSDSLSDKEVAFRWFCLGFAQSKEGYNGECAFPLLAPPNVRHYGDLLVVEEPPDELSGLFQQLWEDDQ